MNIEELKKKDIAEVRQVLIKTWLDTYSNLLPKKIIETAIKTWHSLESLTQNVENPKIYFAVYKKNKKITGLVTASKINKKTLQIFRLYVLPEKQRQGIGNQLFFSAITHFPKIEKVKIEVEVGNQKAISFYKKQGFKKVGQKNLKVSGKGIPVIIKELPLLSSHL